MAITDRYEPKEGDSIEDMLLAFEIKRLGMLRMIKFIKRVKKHSCCVCAPECCISCDALELLRAIGEDK